MPETDLEKSRAKVVVEEATKSILRYQFKDEDIRRKREVRDYEYRFEGIICKCLQQAIDIQRNGFDCANPIALIDDITIDTDIEFSYSVTPVAICRLAIRLARGKARDSGKAIKSHGVSVFIGILTG